MERNPRSLGLMIVAVILVGGGVAILWGKARPVPDLAAEATAASARQDWKRTEFLARKLLKQFPDDPTALQLAAVPRPAKTVTRRRSQSTPGSWLSPWMPKICFSWAEL